MKKCSKCGRELPESCFHKCTASSDGLQSYCSDCANKYHQQLYAQRKAADAVRTGVSVDGSIAPVSDSTSAYTVKAIASLHKVYNSPELAKFTPRELIAELRARGYRGELRIEQIITV